MTCSFIPIALVGAFGKMGCALREILEIHPTFKLKYALVKSSSPVSSTSASFHITSNACDISDVKLIIDFSSKDCFYVSLNLALAQKIPLILGTTGLDSDMLHSLKKASLTIPIVYATNFSLGMTLLQHFLTTYRSSLKNPYIDIHETHHLSKKDLPSGTALSLAAILQDKGQHILLSTPKNRSSEDIVIHSTRSLHPTPSHDIHMLFGDENLSISHTCLSRKPYAEGALEAALFALTQSVGLFTMYDVMHLTSLQSTEGSYAPSLS